MAPPHAYHGVATVGQLRVRPGSPNVVPGGVDFTIDMRHPQSASIESMTAALKTAFEEVTATRAATAEIEETFASAPVDFDAGCVDSVRRAAEHLGLPYQDMVSGAAHDALKVAAVTPAAMIFVPSQGGLSHNEAEWTSPADCAAGVSTLLHAVLGRTSAGG